MPFALFNYSSLSYVILALSSAATYLPNKTYIFHDFPRLENEILTFHDFPGFPWPVRTLYYLTFFNVTRVWLRNLYLDFETQITITKSKNRNLSSRWLLNPDFVDFLLYSSIGKSRKGIEKLFLWTLVLLTLLIHECAKLLFLRRVLFGSPKEMKERKIHEQFSQCWNSVLDFTFDCKSKSRFSNLMHP